MENIESGYITIIIVLFCAALVFFLLFLSEKAAKDAWKAAYEYIRKCYHDLEEELDLNEEEKE